MSYHGATSHACMLPHHPRPPLGLKQKQIKPKFSDHSGPRSHSFLYIQKLSLRGINKHRYWAPTGWDAFQQSNLFVRHFFINWFIALPRTIKSPQKSTTRKSPTSCWQLTKKTWHHSQFRHLFDDPQIRLLLFQRPSGLLFFGWTYRQSMILDANTFLSNNYVTLLRKADSKDDFCLTTCFANWQAQNRSTTRALGGQINQQSQISWTSAQCPGPFLRSCANCFLKIYLIDGKLNCLNEKDISDLVMITGNLISHHHLITLEDSPSSPKNIFCPHNLGT